MYICINEFQEVVNFLRVSFFSGKVHQTHKYKGLECNLLDMKLLELVLSTAKSIIPAILHVSMPLFNCSCPCFKSESRCFTEILIKHFFITAFFI